MDATVKLKPCPFCGGKPQMQELGDADSYSVSCEDCEIQQIANYRPHVAARRWNERKQISAGSAEIEVAIPALTD